MIQLCVDESYAFEYYCILLVKSQRIKSPDAVKMLEQQRLNLIDQMGETAFDSVIQSDEFAKMLEVNSFTFDMVDKAKNNLVKASEVDHCSFLRKIAKDSLQRKFFNEKNLEVKIGYGD